MTLTNDHVLLAENNLLGLEPSRDSGTRFGLWLKQSQGVTRGDSMKSRQKAFKSVNRERTEE